MTEERPLAPLSSALQDVAALLRDQGVAGMVIGGVAASVLGRPRMTRDVDVVVLLNESRWEGFLASASHAGFTPRISNCLEFARKSRVLLLRHESSGIDADIALASLSFEKQAIERASWTKVGDVLIPLPTPEDLIILKAIAQRPRDMADIEGIVETQPELDRARILSTVSEFASALDMPGIAVDLRRLLKQHDKGRDTNPL